MIGIFDSGIGGLTVLKEVFTALPEYQLLYLGDTARTPYGNRSPEVIYEFTKGGVDYLFQQGCELVIIACNTMSAEALRKIQQDYLPAKYPDKKVLGVIRPVAEAAVLVSKSGRIGVVGTRGTVKSGAYERELKTLRPDAKVFQQACPLLVPLVEEGMVDRPETMKILRNYVRPLKQQYIDTLILGCTHYPFLQQQFASAGGKGIKVLDSAKIVAEKLQDYLKRHPEIETKLVKGKQHRFAVTDVTDMLQKNAEPWLGRKINFEKVELK